MLNVQQLDNQIQASFESSAQTSDNNPRNFMYYLAYIEVYHDHSAILWYWGEYINSEWFAEFRLDENQHWISC